MLKEDDVVLKDIIETQRNLQLDKRVTGIKSKSDCFKFMNFYIEESNTNINKEINLN